MNTPEREKFEAWLNKQDVMLIPDCGYESIEGDMAYLAWQAAITTRDEEHDSLVGMLEEEIEQLQAQVGRLRVAGNCIIGAGYTTATNAILEEAISASPSNWLERKLLANEVKLLERLSEKYSNHGAWVFVYELRELRKQLANIKIQEYY